MYQDIVLPISALEDSVLKVLRALLLPLMPDNLLSVPLGR